MKKWKCLFLLITCVVCLIFMFGCKGKEGKNEVEQTLENKTVITGSSKSDTPESAYTNNDVDYTIKTKSILTNNININYEIGNYIRVYLYIFLKYCMADR